MCWCIHQTQSTADAAGNVICFAVFCFCIELQELIRKWLFWLQGWTGLDPGLPLGHLSACSQLCILLFKIQTHNTSQLIYTHRYTHTLAHTLNTDKWASLYTCALLPVHPHTDLHTDIYFIWFLRLYYEILWVFLCIFCLYKSVSTCVGLFHIHVPPRMHCNNLGDPWTFHLESKMTVASWAVLCVWWESENVSTR